MAKEYIDREALLQDIKETVVYTARPDRENLIGRGVRLVLDRIAAAPAADVAPVVHGRWVFVCEHENRLDYECTNCLGHIQIIKEPDYIMAYKRCPNCGAKMDGERKEGADNEP